MERVVGASFVNGVGTVTYVDGTTKEMTYLEYLVSKRDFEPRSIAELIRFLNDKGAFYDGGHRRSLQHVYTGQSYHWFHGKDLVTPAEFEKVMEFLKRYRRFYHYCKEVSPQWKEVDRLYWADNSVEAVQENKFGETRRVMVTAPHGDVCY